MTELKVFYVIYKNNIIVLCIGKPCRKNRKLKKCHKTCGKTNETVPCCQILNKSETENCSVKL